MPINSILSMLSHQPQAHYGTLVAGPLRFSSLADEYRRTLPTSYSIVLARGRR